MTKKKQIVEQFAMGCIPSKKDIRDYRLNKKVCHVAFLPNEFKVEHSSIKNQGSVGSCVAHSVTEVLEQLQNNEMKYSTAWIYGYRPLGYYQGMGMQTSQALKTTKNVGCIKYEDCIGNFEMPIAKEFVSARLDEYKELASKDRTTSYAKLRTLQEIKEAIYKTGKPVIVCIMCDNLKLDKDYIAQLPKNAKGGHAVVCYGWNETGLLIQNSWGEKWGNKGCFILPYEYPFIEAWVLTKDENVVIKPSAFVLREFLVNLGKVLKQILSMIFKKK